MGEKQRQHGWDEMHVRVTGDCCAYQTLRAGSETA